VSSLSLSFPDFRALGVERAWVLTPATKELAADQNFCVRFFTLKIPKNPAALISVAGTYASLICNAFSGDGRRQ
jgi:hypothetical protein